MVELRGHAAALELPPGGAGGFDDLWDLGFDRSKAAFDFFTQDLGLDPDRFRLTSNAAREPLDARAVDSGDAQVNRRVEVLVSESLKQDFTKPESGGRS